MIRLALTLLRRDLMGMWGAGGAWLPVLFFIGVPVLLLSMVAGSARPAPPPPAAVLSLDLRRGLTDQDSGSINLFKGSTLSVMSVVQTLHRAETDGRVKALFVRLPEAGISPGEADELRLAFRKFRAAGKPLGQGLRALEGGLAHLAGALAINRYGGRERVQLRLLDAAPAPM